MYCTSCGKKIEEGQVICEECEAKKNAVGAENNNCNNAGTLLMMFLGAVGLQVLQIILWFCDFIKVEQWGFSESISMHGLMSTELEQTGTSIATVVIYIITIVLTLLPILRNTLHKRHRMIAPILLSLWGFVCFVLYSMVLFNGNSQSNVGCSYTMGGWLFILIEIALVVLHISIARKTAK